MTLEKGTRLGIYEITAHIGHGGMGEVYRARDTTLGRDVAIKTLPSALAQESDRLARFEREAKLLAALNHAHIAAVYGLHEHEGTKFFAMELVDGETLDRKAKGGLSVEKALRLALQIAAALEAAHEKGVVHRDLKPANIMVTRDDQVKVLDFGLAKAFSGDPGATMPANSPALSLAMTKQGFILGTAGYMSPEQASGQASDQRADIWAFGVVLFEMLAGSPLFSGESVPHILADVLRSEPDWKRLPKHLHPRLRLLLERCLTKNARDRYHSIADARVDIEAVLSRPEAAAEGVPARARLRAWPLVGAVLAGGVAVGSAGLALWPAQPPRPVIRFATPVPPAASVPLATLSRDGMRIAIRAGSPSQFYVRKLDELDWRPIPASASPSVSLPACFSPDGDSIAFSTGKSLKKAPLAGGAALTIADDLDAADVCDWADDGNIYFGATPGIMRVAAVGGHAELAAGFDAASGETSYENPQLLPGGKQLLFSVLRGGLNNLSVVVLDLATREKKTVLEGAGFARYVPTGPGAARSHLVYGRQGALFAAPFDLRTLITGPSSPVLEGVASFGPIALVSVSATGTLAYAAGGSLGFGTKLRWVDRAGTAQELPEAAHTFGELTLSPDGRRVATSIFDVETLTSDLWLYELDGDRLTRVTFGGLNGAPIWTPDGRRLIYWHSDSIMNGDGELRSVPADSSAAPVALATLKSPALLPTSISADGTTLVGVRQRGTANDIWSLSLGDAGAATGEAADPKPVLETSFDERDAMLSPDARFLAYTSNESGRDEVYVIPFPGPGGKTQVSTGGGKLPRWNPNGRELFYSNGAQLLAVDVETSPAFRRLTPKILFDAPSLANTNSDRYAVAPDGSRFLMLTEGFDQPSELRVVVNWFEELRRLAPAK